MSYTFKKILSAVKFIFAFVFIHLFCISLHAQALDTLYIGWTGEPGELEDAINSNPDFDVYVLESNKVFLQEKALVLNNSCQIIGAPYGDGEHPAAIRPTRAPNDEQFYEGWPQAAFITFGDYQHYKLSNIYYFGSFHNDHDASLASLLVDRGAGNSFKIDKVISSHMEVITYFSFGSDASWEITNNKAIQYSTYSQGMYFGGFFWGGGSWMGGEFKSVVIQNNTIEGAYGNPIVIAGNGLSNQSQQNHILIDHNTFVNSTLEAHFRGV